MLQPALLSESSSVGLSSSLSTGVGDSHVEQLVNLLQCCHSRCTDYDCVQVGYSWLLLGQVVLRLCVCVCVCVGMHVFVCV